MNAETKFPRNQGRPIAIGKGRAEQARWKKNPNNAGLPDSFPVSVELILKNISNPLSTGIQFCNGLNGQGEYAPVMASVDETGKALSAFGETGEISLDEFRECRSNWKAAHPNPNTTQFFFLGEESLKINIADFDISRYVASFVEKANNKNSAILFGYSDGGMKDPGDDDPSSALNIVKICPPDCDNDIG